MTVTVTAVRVFDGDRLLDGFHDVTVDGGSIASIIPTAHAPARDAGPEEVDGSGATLLPGFIDAHVHLTGVAHLHALARAGVTTALDMGSWPVELVEELRHTQGTADIRSVGTPAIGPGGPHARIPGRPADALVTTPDQARAYVAKRVAEGSDYIKIITEPPGRGGPDQATLDALVAAAHDRGKLVVAHASALGAVVMSQAAGVDVLTHVPLDAALDDAGVTRVLSDGRAVVPTLTMMEGIVRNAARPGIDYRHARDSVAALHRAGVPIIAGTDANSSPGVPANVPHGTSLHRELELLVDAGLTPLEALRSATSVAARCFALNDRGRVEVGHRADLVLVEGDPSRDITATRNRRAVWIRGQCLP